MNFRILLSAAPVGVFLALTRLAPPWVAILAGFATSVAVFTLTRRNELIGVLMVLGLAVTSVSAVVGIVQGSEKAYLAAGPVSDFLFVPLYASSILMRRPLVGAIARELFPSFAGGVPTDARLYLFLSIAWAAFDLFHGVAALLLLQRLSVGEYIIWSRIALWPLTGALLVISVGLIARTARDAGQRATEFSP